jgi:uncharacterized RDD family membrane protein YckC
MSTDLNNHYAPPKSNVADVGGADEEANLASRWARLGAAMLDGLILTVGFIPSYAQLFRGNFPRNSLDFWGAMATTGIWAMLAAAWLLIILGLNLYFIQQNGQTIGKKLVGIKVVRTDGSRISLSRYFFLRYLLSTAITMVPDVGGLYSLVDSLFIFGKPRRCIHDYIADTIVIGA